MSDGRLPVLLVLAAGATAPGDLVVADPDARLAPPEGALPVPFRGHPALCGCCGGRAAFATLLGRLFTERAKGERPFFGRIVAVSDRAGLQAAREALGSDPLLAGRYREDDGEAGGPNRVGAA